MNTLHKTYAMLIGATFIWGIQPLCIKWLAAAWTPVTITTMRYFLIGAFLLGLSLLRGEGIVPRKDCIMPLLAMGVTGIGINNVLQFTGLQISTVTNCTLIAAASPAITACLAAWWIRERLSGKAWIGILLSFLGAIVVVSHGSWEVIRHVAFNRGDIYFLVAQVAWTTYSIMGVQVMKKMPPVLTTGWAGICGALITLLYGTITQEFQVTMLEGSLWASFGYTVIFGGIMAMLFWNIGVKNAGPSITAIFQNVTPVVGMIGGSLAFAEQAGCQELLGAVLIFGGVYLTTHSKRPARA